MTRLPVRLTLLLACVAAIGYAAFLTWSSERHARLIDTSSRQFTTEARAISSSAAELRSAQQSYVAVGQGEDFWIARVTAIVADLREKLAALRSLATTPEAVVAVDDASGALQDFEQMDRRARDYARNRELALASDLVFTDGFDLTKKTGESIERAVTAELTSRDALVGGLRRVEGVALGAAAGLATLGLLLLLPRGRKREVVDRAAPAVAAPIATASLQALDDLQDFAVVDKRVAPAPPVPPVLSVLPTPSAVDLGGVAALCVELAELPDMIRGYEDIKLDNVARYRERVAALRTQIEGVTS